MIFGIGEGKIDLVLEKMNFAYGETVKGKLKLDLPKPTKAKELRVELSAIKKVQESIRSSTGKTRYANHDKVIYSFKLSLGGDQEYLTKEYDFELKLPPPPVQSTQPVPGWIGEAMNVLTAFSVASPVRWYVNASLDRPMSFDVSKKVQITVQ